jgi:uncharacterized integral membrane protein
MLLGPHLSIPVGFAIFSAIIVGITIVFSDVMWKVMEHLPEDDEDWSPEHHFVIDEGK